MLTVAVAAPGVTILAPEPSFVMYRMNALYAGARFVGVPLAADFALDTSAMLEAIERERPALIFLAYPNNPTGNLFAPDGIEAILRAAPGLVVVDEAYHAFADASFLPRLARVSEPRRHAHGLEDRDGGAAPGLCHRRARMDDGIEQGPPAV